MDVKRGRMVFLGYGKYWRSDAIVGLMPIEDDRGRTVGEHVGLSFYTLGQRKGIGLGGVKERSAARGGSDHAPARVRCSCMPRATANNQPIPGLMP